jgi:hypothetical protein
MHHVASRSVPSVEIVGSNNVLESIELSGVVSEFHAFGVTSAESFSDPGVMKSLSVSETLVSNGKTEGEAEHKSSSNSHVVSVEVKLTGGSETTVVGVRNAGSSSSEAHSGGSSHNSGHVGGVEEVHVEVVGRVLDGVNSLDLTLHLFVSLFEVGSVACDFRSVATHFYILINNYNENNINATAQL